MEITRTSVLNGFEALDTSGQNGLYRPWRACTVPPRGIAAPLLANPTRFAKKAGAARQAPDQGIADFAVWGCFIGRSTSVLFE